MKNDFALLILLLLTLTSTYVNAGTGHLVAPLNNQTSIDGCSWSASSPAVGRGFIYLAEPDSSKTLMNIDGVDVPLKLVTERGRLLKVGDVLDREFENGNVLVNVRYKATWVCPKTSESCEVTQYDALFDVSKGSRRQLVKARGEVGC